MGDKVKRSDKRRWKTLITGIIVASLGTAAALGTSITAHATVAPTVSPTVMENEGFYSPQSVNYLDGIATSDPTLSVSWVKAKVAIHEKGTSCAWQSNPMNNVIWLNTTGGLNLCTLTTYNFTCYLSSPGTHSTSFFCGPGSTYGNLVLPTNGSYQVQFEVNDSSGVKTSSQVIDFTYGAAPTSVLSTNHTADISIMFGRAQWEASNNGATSACVGLTDNANADLSNLGTGTQTVNLNQIAQWMQGVANSAGITGWNYQGDAENVDQYVSSASSGTPCTKANLYASWAQLAALCNGTPTDYFWGCDSESYSYPSTYAQLQSNQAQETTQGDADIMSHTGTCGCGVFAYPNNHYYDSSGSAGGNFSVQCANYPNCQEEGGVLSTGLMDIPDNYDWGRTYAGYRNFYNQTYLNEPDFQSTYSVNGGVADNTTGVKCANDICSGGTGGAYTPPDELLQMVEKNPVTTTTCNQNFDYVGGCGSWSAIQFYKLLVGSCTTGCGVNGSETWNCNGATNTHFAELGGSGWAEAYCLTDFQAMINAIPKDGTVAVLQPASVGTAMGIFPGYPY
jgi:hypothetical protein